MASVLDLFSRKLLACPTSEHPDAVLACDAIKIASAARGGRDAIDGVIFHSDRGSTYTASSFTVLCKDKLGIRQSMGRVGSCFDNAAAESFFSTLESRGPVPAPLRHQGRSPHRGLGLVPPVLQPHTSAQLGGDAGTGGVRTRRCPARPGTTGGSLMSRPSPSGDVCVTAPTCLACGQQLLTGRSRRFCSPASRQAAYRRRHQPAASEAPLPPSSGRRGDGASRGSPPRPREPLTRFAATQFHPSRTSSPRSRPFRV